MLQLDHDKGLNYVLNLEKKNYQCSERSKWQRRDYSVVVCNHLCPCGCCPSTFYGLTEVHKLVTDWYPYLRSILSAINTASYKLVKFLVPLSTPLTSNDYTIKDSFSFEEEVSPFDCAHYLTSFDIEPLFTKIPWEETINICADKLIENKTKVNNLTKESFRTLLKLTF